jgi:hypothetical protein
MMTASAQSNRDRHLAKGWRLGAVLLIWINTVEGGKLRCSKRI